MSRAAGDSPYYEFVMRHKATGEVIPNCTIEFPSVTHIISTVLNKPQLVNWAYRQTVDNISALVEAWYMDSEATAAEIVEDIRDAMVLDEKLAENFMRPIDIRDEAAERGSQKHALLEVLAGLPVDDGIALAGEWANDTDPYASAIGKWWGEKQPVVVAAEAKLWSLAHGFAGTCDLIWKDQWKNLVITDLKTGNAGRIPYDSDDIQTGAYEIGYLESNPRARVARRSILIVRENGTFGEYTCTIPTTAFLTIKAVYDMLYAKEVKR